jgi:hypothetical protein
MKQSKFYLSLLISLGFCAHSFGMEDASTKSSRVRKSISSPTIVQSSAIITQRTTTHEDDELNPPEAYKAMREVVSLYESGVCQEECLKRLTAINCSDDNAPEIDQDRLEKALWILILGNSDKAKEQARRMLELNLVSNSDKVELLYRLQSMTLGFFSGCGDEGWVRAYLPSLNNRLRALHAQVPYSIKDENFEEARTLHLTMTIGIVALNYLVGNKVEGLELWRERPHTSQTIIVDMGMEEPTIYNSEDPSTFLQDWQTCEAERIAADISNAKAQRTKPAVSSPVAASLGDGATK